MSESDTSAVAHAAVAHAAVAHAAVAHAAVGAAYRVLARKYRPRTFSELIGQDALVRTLSNAIRSGRIAQAFMLTGVRGVGKTTTARIIARALNCVGADGTGGPTITPCGICDNCRAIAEDRHVDVMEMDAASHTGVDDIREIIDGVRYAPVAARYKLYIIDEVHMLSKNAFNALLKTLEEPPEHVKFVFATTEIRKVPVTVLSRCQRFDLRRVEMSVLRDHFTRIAGQEAATLEPDAAALLARAADGSVRDGLSLLDQAIALAAGTVTAEQVRDMLGLADRARVMDLLETALTAKPAEALDILADLHRSGADPVVILQDLLDLTHELTRLRVVPGSADDAAMPETERTRGAVLSGKLGMAALTRTWQILLKGLGEVRSAPIPHQALDMVIIRLAYAADLPTPADLVRKLRADPSQAGGGGPGGGAGRVPTGGGGPSASAAMAPRFEGSPQGAPVASAPPQPRAVRSVPQPVAQTAAQPGAQATPAREVETISPAPLDFPGVVKLFMDRREGLLGALLRSDVHLVAYEPGRLEFRPSKSAPANLSNKVAAMLEKWTARPWVVAISQAAGEPTLAEVEEERLRQVRAEIDAHPLVQAVMRTFAGAVIKEWREPEPVEVEIEATAAEELGEEEYPVEDYPLEDYPMDD